MFLCRCVHFDPVLGHHLLPSRVLGNEGEGQAKRIDQVPEPLLEAAREQTGLDVLGDDTLPGRISDLCAQLDERLDERGRELAATTIIGLLVQRLELFDSFRRYPLADERIERPFIAFGEGRSGTTVRYSGR